jgi:D-alanyl-D-alanine carboxypeptidase
LLVVLLGSGPDPARFRDAARLLDVGFEAFEEVSPLVAYELASGAGWWSTEPVGRSSLLVPIGAEVGVVVEPPSLIVGGITRAHVVVDAQEAVELRLSMRAPDIRWDRQGASASARLAAGVADGVFAGLRAAVAVDGLG